MNIHGHTDSIDGKSFERQLSIFVTFLGLLLVSWFIIIGFEWIVFSLAGYSEEAGSYIANIYPLTLLIWGALWISLAPKGFVNPKANHIQATHNTMSADELKEGGTRFIVYQTGFALKYLWEKLQGEEIIVENEVRFEGDLTTISIKEISLEMKLSFLYRVHLPNLSAFLQNRTEADGLKGIINQLKAASNQYVEEAASAMNNTEEVRSSQTSIINTMLTRLRDEAEPFGINILSANFSKCDYSDTTQKELNKLIEARTITRIANEMGLEDRGRAMELAAVAAGKSGAKVSRAIHELVMTPEVAQAAKEAGPVAAALFAKAVVSSKPPEENKKK